MFFQIITSEDGRKTIRLFALFFISISVGAISLYVIFFMEDVNEGNRQVAAGFVGAILGYWLK